VRPTLKFNAKATSNITAAAILSDQRGIVTLENRAGTGVKSPGLLGPFRSHWSLLNFGLPFCCGAFAG
jgi:hypothetical protein